MQFNARFLISWPEFPEEFHEVVVEKTSHETEIPQARLWVAFRDTSHGVHRQRRDIRSTARTTISVSFVFNRSNRFRPVSRVTVTVVHPPMAESPATRSPDPVSTETEAALDMMRTSGAPFRLTRDRDRGVVETERVDTTPRPQASRQTVGRGDRLNVEERIRRDYDRGVRQPILSTAREAFAAYDPRDPWNWIGYLAYGIGPLVAITKVARLLQRAGNVSDARLLREVLSVRHQIPISRQRAAVLLPRGRTPYARLRMRTPSPQNNLAREMASDGKNDEVIDALVDEVKRLRANAGIAHQDFFGTNAASASVIEVTESGDTRRIMVGAMNAEVRHSEIDIVNQVNNLKRDGPDSLFYIEAIFTERSACYDCLTFIRRNNLIDGQEKNSAIFYVTRYTSNRDANARGLTRGWGLNTN